MSPSSTNNTTPKVDTPSEGFRPAAETPQDVAQLNSDLANLKETAKNLLEQAKEISKAPGPTFDGELHAHVAKALEDCDSFDQRGKLLLDKDYVKNASGMSDNVKQDLLDVASIRQELQQFK